jgi:hypothetical protein
VFVYLFCCGTASDSNFFFFAIVLCVCVCLWARPGNFLVVGCCRKEAEAGVNEMAKNEREKMKREESVGARYVTALRANLLTKLNKKGLHVPNLCACVPPSSTCHWRSFLCGCIFFGGGGW